MNKRFYGGLSIKPTKGQVQKLGVVVINFDVIQRMANVYIILASHLENNQPIRVAHKTLKSDV